MAKRSPSEFVGPQVKAFRERRRWKQQDLVNRLSELGFPGWRQSKITKIEKGQATRLALDDVFELAVALDVTPLYLVTPTEPERDGEGEIVEVQLGPKISRRPIYVREWVRGQLPLFDPKEEPLGARFYLAESPPVEEFRAEEFMEWMRSVQAAEEERERLRGSSVGFGADPTPGVKPPKPKQRKERKQDAR
jgi:transcriptional regulator with XRE-family HTH domain